MPGASGLEVRRIRKDSKISPSHRHVNRKEDEDAKITGLSVADDFITKPFSPRELVARLKAICVEPRPKGSRKPWSLMAYAGPLVSGPLSMNRLTLSPLEFRLLQTFMTHPNRAFSRAQLLDRVWGVIFMLRSAPSTCISAASESRRS